MNKKNNIEDIFLVKTVNLEDIFVKSEIEELLKESILSNRQEQVNSFTNINFENLTEFKNDLNHKKNIFKYSVNDLIIKFLTLAIDKLNISNKTIAKSIRWVKEELKDILFQKDYLKYSYVKQENINQKIENNDLKYVFGWIDNSSINNYINEDTKTKLSYKNINRSLSLKTSYNFKQQLNTLEYNFNNCNIKKPRNSVYVNPNYHLNNSNINYLASNLNEKIKDINSFDFNRFKNNNILDTEYGNFTNKENIDINSNSNILANKDSNLLFNKICNKYNMNYVDSYTNTNKNINKKSKNKLAILDESILNSINEKDFDIFKYENYVGKANVLPYLSINIFFNYSLYNIVKINYFENFLEHIRTGYLEKNPYHNDIHAADVLQTCYSMLMHSNIIEIIMLDKFDIASLFISAIIHDFKHPGLTNGFLITTKNKLALDYNGN